MKIGILGCGSWGSAIANLLARIGHEVHIYTRNEKQYARIQSVGDNPGYLEDFTFDPSIQVHLSVEETIDGADGIVGPVHDTYGYYAVNGSDDSLLRHMEKTYGDADEEEDTDSVKSKKDADVYGDKTNASSYESSEDSSRSSSSSKKGTSSTSEKKTSDSSSKKSTSKKGSSSTSGSDSKKGSSSTSKEDI